MESLRIKILISIILYYIANAYIQLITIWVHGGFGDDKWRVRVML
jgi:hypothetical protein